MGFIILKLLIGKWHQKLLRISHKLSTTNSAAHTLHLCSTTMDSKSTLRKSDKSSRPQETLLNHTGQCSSLRPLREPMLEISSPKLPQLAQLVVVVAPAQLPLLKKHQRKEKKVEEETVDMGGLFGDDD